MERKYKFTMRYEAINSIESSSFGKFIVTLLCNGEKEIVKEFESHMEAFEWISDTMCGLQIAGEDWTFSY